MINKYLFSSLLIFFIHILSLNNLYSELIIRDGGQYIRSDDRKYVWIEKGIPSLDFSNECPFMDTFVINVTNYSPYYYWHAEDDYGLSNNVFVKTLTVAGLPTQKLLKWTHMPNIETFRVSRIYEDYNYLEYALPSIKSLEVILYNEQYYPARSTLFKTLDNISKLKNLEHLTLHMVSGWHNSGFTPQEELPILEKMQQLKTFKIIFSDVIPGQTVFNEHDLEVLKYVTLPNTDIKVETHYREPQDGG